MQHTRRIPTPDLLPTYIEAVHNVPSFQATYQPYLTSLCNKGPVWHSFHKLLPPWIVKSSTGTELAT